MTSLSMRPYQAEAVETVFSAWSSGMRRPALVLGTGLGKTHIFSHVIERYRRETGKRVVVLVHRDELARQAVAKIRSIAPRLSVGRVQAGDDEIFSDVMVCSVQTLAVARRRNALVAAQEEHGPIGLLVHDEAHHSVARSWVAISDAFPDALHLGVTATLERGDGVGLGSTWDDVVYSRSPLWGMKHGYLVQPRAFTEDVGSLNLSSVRRSGGDYSSADLGRALEESEVPSLLPAAWKEHAEGRPTLAFTPTVATAHAVTEAFRGAGVTSAVISGETPVEERQRIFEDFRLGRTRVLSNCMVLTEGTDLPWASCAIVARPTRSRALYCLDESTEILTDQGWKGVDDDLSRAHPAAYDMADGSVRWSPLLARVERTLGHEESMYGLESPTASVRVSDRHRMVWRGRNGSWRVSDARDLATRRTEYRVPIAGLQSAPGVPLSEPEIEFLGWFLTDGNHNESNNVVSISQAEHQPWNEDIRACLTGCGFKYRVQRYSGDTNFKATSDRLVYRVSKGTPRGEDKHLRGWGALAPYIDKDLSPALEALTREQLAVMLRTMHMGNGSKQLGQSWTRRSYHISTGNKTMADRLQSLCVRRGFKCNVAVYRYNSSPLYMLHIKDTTEKSVGGCGQSDREHLAVVDHAPGERVWCVETDAGTVVTRRNGKVMVLGNCQMVGRVLRPWQGKTDAVVINVAGGGGKISTLVDLAPGSVKEVRDGEGLVEAEEREELEAVAEESARTEIQRRHTLRLKEVRSLFEASHQAWGTTAGGVMFLAAGEWTYFLWPSPGGGWDVCRKPQYRGKWERTEHQGLDVEMAMSWAEAEAEEHGSFSVSRNASWRRGKPTEKQVAYAESLGIVVGDMGKAALNDAISYVIESRALDPFIGVA